MDIDANIYKMNIQGLPPFDEKMIFYYDETGNCRKFTLTEKGFNDSNAVYKNSILGGIAFVNTPDEKLLSQLYSNLGFVEGEQPELKFKNLYHNKSPLLICNINSNRSIIDREKKLKILAHIIE